MPSLAPLKETLFDNQDTSLIRTLYSVQRVSLLVVIMTWLTIYG